METVIKFNNPKDNEALEAAIYSSQLKQVVNNIRAKVAFNLEKDGNIPNQRRQVYAEINNMIRDELTDGGIAHLFC